MTLLAVLGSVLGATPAVIRPQSAPPAELRAFDHTAWTAREGAPDAIAALAQTTDGYLWIGTPQGLYRFDGLRFERFEPAAGETMPSQNIAGLYTTPDSALWIGYRFGGASRLAHGRMTTYGPSSGLPSASLWDFARDVTGTLWGATSRGLFRLEGARWKLDSANALPHASANAVLVDARGTFWVASDSGTFARRRGANRFVQRGPSIGPVNAGSLREAPDSTIWALTIEGRLVALADADTTAMRVVRAVSRGGRTLLVDQEGMAWVGGVDGLHRVVAGAPTGGAPNDLTPPMTRRHGASGNTVLAMFEDREGNVWVGTEGGLDRFRHTKLAALALTRPVVGPSIAFGDGGTTWVGNSSGPSYRIVGDTVVALGPVDVTCAARDFDGSVWLGSATGVWYAPPGHRDALEPVPRPAGSNGAEVQAIARDRQGRVWLSVVRRGVQVRVAGAWHEFDGPPGVAYATAVTIAADSAGVVWLGYTDDRVVRVRGDSTQLLTVADGVRVGTVMTVYVHRQRVWIGGERGAAYFDGVHFRPLRLAEGASLHGVSGIVERADGELWFNSADGVTRVPAGEARRALADSAYDVRAERLDYHDGIDGSAPQLRPQPSALAGPDGRLWFVSTASVLWIDPTRIRRNPIAPPVQVRLVEAGGRAYDPSTLVRLPKRTTSMRIAYTALGLAAPERVRFRYRLTGSDAAWQDAAGRREISFGNLRPGPYQFHVTAANEDGVWNEAGASVSIIIPPTFVQTRAFLLLCLITAAGAGLMLLRWRQHQLAKAMRVRFDATLAERTRIAQELHDTLLQGFTGVTLELYAVRRLLAATRSNEAADSLERAIEGADATLLDARHAVWEMRSVDSDDAGLPETLASAARDVIGVASVNLRFTTHGDPLPLARSVEVTAFRIGREAVANAVAHADARTIEITLSYAATSLTLVVRDDGRGFSPEVADAARRRGHWGLAGMRERAAAAGATLVIDTAPGRGTAVALTLPLDGT